MSLDADAIALAFGRHTVFSDLSLRLGPGEIVGLIGPPESGKSVLLKVLAGLIEPSAGRVSIDGVAFADHDEHARYRLRRQIGMVFQNNALFDSMTIYDNVAFPLRALARMGEVLAPREIERRTRERLHAVGLSHALSQFPHELSGGMKKRAGIARATVTTPRYCFYDEPTAGLDPVTSAKIYALIRCFAEEDGAGAIVISNDIDTLLGACHRLVMLYAGAMVFSGSPEALATADHPAVRQFVNGSNEGPL